jgi:nucleoid DNA-binding protein
MAETKAPKSDGAGKAMSKSAVYQLLSDSTKLTKKQVAEFFDALTALVKRELGKKGPGVFNALPGLVQLKVRRMPATKAQKGRPNPFKPGEVMDVKAKPARNVVKPRALKSLKDMVK